MAIINKADMVRRFGEMEIAELSDHVNHSATNDEVLNQAIEDAEAEAYSYLLPVGLDKVTPPKSLKLRICDMARYYLCENSTTQVIEDRYKYAIEWLEKVMNNPAMIAELKDQPDKARQAKSIPLVRR